MPVRAVVITEPGGPDVLQLRDVPDPVPAEGEVVVEVAATAVNRADLLQRQGHYDPPPGTSPYLGLECSGAIAELGTGVSGWRVGDQVCALLSGGGYAERVVAPVGHVLPVPDGLSTVDAAALPEATCTVWSMVFDIGRLRPGETLLVHGGASGVGTMAIQLAHRYGARVIATAGSARKLDACRELGADMTINYREQDFAAMFAGQVDVILDNIGAAYLARNLTALAIGGRLLSLGLQGGRKAELDLEFCYVRAEFDALVVNLHTAIGAFVSPGPTPVFSLVDTRAWYVLADYRETELDHIAPGMEAEVYVLTDPHYRFRGTVQGIGWAVNPEDQPITPGVPQIKRELNWVHIAQRFPVRIRIEKPDPADVFRVGASAVAIVRGWPAERPAGSPH